MIALKKKSMKKVCFVSIVWMFEFNDIDIVMAFCLAKRSSVVQTKDYVKSKERLWLRLSEIDLQNDFFIVFVQIMKMKPSLCFNVLD